MSGERCSAQSLSQPAAVPCRRPVLAGRRAGTFLQLGQSDAAAHLRGCPGGVLQTRAAEPDLEERVCRTEGGGGAQRRRQRSAHLLLGGHAAAGMERGQSRRLAEKDV